MLIRRRLNPNLDAVNFNLNATTASNPNINPHLKIQIARATSSGIPPSHPDQVMPPHIRLRYHKSGYTITNLVTSSQILSSHRESRHATGIWSCHCATMGKRGVSRRLPQRGTERGREGENDDAEIDAGNARLFRLRGINAALHFSIVAPFSTRTL